MDQQGQRSSSFEEKMKDIQKQFAMNASIESLSSIKGLISELKSTIKTELSNGNVHNATMLKEKMTKHFSMQEINKMSSNLDKLYKAK